MGRFKVFGRPELGWGKKGNSYYNEQSKRANAKKVNAEREVNE